jgi:predicted small secreted protein
MSDKRDFSHKLKFMGCEMIKGAGKDIEKGGKEIQKAAN